jgi:hypothetical protein
MEKVDTKYYRIAKMGTVQFYAVSKYFDDIPTITNKGDYSLAGKNYTGITRHVYYRYQMYDTCYRKLEPNGAYKVAGDLSLENFTALEQQLDKVTDDFELAKLMLVTS